MDFSGRYDIPAPPQIVWQAINDPEVLKLCIPGCESIAKTDDTHFEAAAKLKIGPVSATFKGKVSLEDLEPPHRCTLRGEGQGGVAGFAKGEAEVVLTPSEAGTVLTYTAAANIGGKLAQIGQRLIAGAVKQIADDFFAKFAAEVTQRNAPAALELQAEAAAVQAEAVAEAEGNASGMTIEPVATEPLVAVAIAPETVAHRPASDADDAGDGVAPEIWVVGLVAVIAILLILFSLVL